MADLTSGRIPYATGAAQIDDTTFDFAADQIVATASLSSVIGAAIVNAGTGGTPGAATVTGTTGTGTKFEAAVTIEAGGTIESVDSISVAGAYTVPPTDPTAEPVTGGGLTGATLNLGLSFAASIVGGDVAAGLSFNAIGEPMLALFSGGELVTLTATATAGDFEVSPGVSLEANTGSFFGLAIQPTIGVIGHPYLDMIGYGGGGAPIIELLAARGQRGAALPSQNDDVLSQIVTLGYGTTFNGNSVTLETRAAENFDGSHQAALFKIKTINLAQSDADRLVIDGSGNVKQKNGVFALDTGGNDAGIAIGSLPGSPTLGMMAVVNDALAPAVGIAVAASGAATALVWWNGAQWTVMGV